MAYARLIFPTGTTPLQKIKDMVKFCTGGISTVTDLEFADQVTSEVIVTEAPGWSIADAASALEASGTATISDYRLSAPCVDTNKTKYCEFKGMVYGHGDLIGTGSTLVWTNSSLTSASTAGALFVPIGSGTTGTSLDNAVMYLYDARDPDGNGVYRFYFRTIDLGTSVLEYYISVSARKLFVYSYDGTSPSAIMNLEFPETHATTTYNNVPFAFFQWFNPPTPITFSGTGSIYWPYGGSYNRFSNSGTNYQGGSSYFYRFAMLTNWYRHSDKTRSVRRADDALDTMFAPVDPPVIVNPSTLETIYPLVQMIDERSKFNEGVHNYSSLTDVYWTKNGITGDTITNGSDDYTILTFNGSRSLAIKKA